MKPGAVVIDLAGASGGNCALSRPGEVVDRRGVEIHAPLNLPAAVPADASQLYARNVAAFAKALIKDGALAIDLADDVVGPSCVAHGGVHVHPKVAAALG